MTSAIPWRFFPLATHFGPIPHKPELPNDRSSIRGYVHPWNYRNVFSGNIDLVTVSSQLPRLCLAITELQTGGAERCLANLACGLATRGFSVQTLSLAPLPAAPRDGLVQQLQEHQIPIHCLNVTSARQFLSARRRLQLYLAEQRIELIQSFLYHPNVLTASLRKKTTPWIHVSGIRVADPSRWRQRIESWAARRWQHSVCVSQDVARFAQQRLRLPDTQISVIPNGINVSAFELDHEQPPVISGLPAGRRFLVSVGRLDRQKGLDWLLEMAPELLGRCPDHDLVLVGDGPERQSLKSQSFHSGFTERIHFLGWRPDIPKILDASDLLLLPSRWEGMPNVLLEAMASALPVVCRDVHGARELLGPDDQGQIASTDTSQAFLEQVIQLASNPASRAAAATQNRQRVLDHFTLEGMIQSYVNLYSRLLSTR
jgi:glycosyltransferase involved in cell wall biosynthesis